MGNSDIEAKNWSNQNEENVAFKSLKIRDSYYL